MSCVNDSSIASFYYYSLFLVLFFISFFSFVVAIMNNLQFTDRFNSLHYRLCHFFLYPFNDFFHEYTLVNNIYKYMNKTEFYRKITSHLLPVNYWRHLHPFHLYVQIKKKFIHIISHN